VDTDATTRELDGGRAREADHGVFARRVRTERRRRTQPRDRRGVHDRAAAARDHGGRDGLETEPHAFDVYRQHTVEGRLRAFDQRAYVAEDAGVVEEKIDAAEALGGGSRVAPDVVPARDVGLHRQRRRARTLGRDVRVLQRVG